MSLIALAAVALVTLVTSFISGILGMAGGMILMGALIVVLPLPAAMMLHGITQFAANGWRGWLQRESIDARVVRGYAMGALVALGCFAAVQVLVSKPVALIILGAMPFVGLLLPRELHLNVERRGHPVACGLVCTALSFVAGISGPILDVFFIRSTMGRHAVVATKAVVQTLTHALKVAYFGGIVAADTAGFSPGVALLMVVLAFAGTSLSRGVLQRMDDTSFRAWTKWTLVSVGAVYLVGGATLLLQ